ncbi:response regulator [Sinimarinibacterium sp. NLF-5-8]|uniref:response regulator n=1 Tax=Sinimarinibacterium sp. NLF-5-8 TaxID=2698684 RepID=UPI00137B97F7|nr:response regulator [Sinimarinibacterium sp. NLF-5-8]QHS09617.1 response regulator [Sinimarinibacterium sp. NLF-5-8]
MPNIKVMLVDDHRLVRAGLKRMLLEADDLTVVAEAGSGEQALELAPISRPDVVLMDINMPGIGGLEATRRLVQRSPDCKVIVVSMYVDEPYPSQMLGAGAVGYISKDAVADEVIDAIRRVHEGRRYVASDIVGQIVVGSSDPAAEATPFDSLSQRETQIMKLLLLGQSNQAISDQLHLSPKTVSTYRYRMYEKLGIANDVELMRLAMRYGLLDDSGAISQTVHSRGGRS